MKQVLIVEDQRMPRKYMESMISDSKYYPLQPVSAVQMLHSPIVSGR